LFLGEEPGVRQALLERVDEAVDGARERQTRQVGEMVRAQGRTETLLAESAEGRPRNVVDTTGVALKHVVPLLGAVH